MSLTPPLAKERNLPPTSQGSKEADKTAFLPPKARLAAAGVVIFLLVAIIFGRLFLLQVVSPDRYVEWGKAQRSREFSIAAPRGDILDRNGEPLAVSLRVSTIWADPQLVTEHRKVSQALSPILEMKPTELMNLLTKRSRFVYLKRKVSSQVAEQVADLKFPGVYLLPEYQRKSPAGENLGLSVVGFVGSEDQGLGGVEYSFNELLTGENGQVSFEGSVRGNVLDPDLLRSSPARQGSNLQLTLDKNLQHEAERLIIDAVTEYKALSGTILATRPATGEILAMATALSHDAPNIEPGQYSESKKDNKDSESTTERIAVISDDNRALTWAYEPGSALKPVLFSGIFESGVGTPDSLKEVPDTHFLYDSKFSDHIPHDPEEWNISDIVTVSSNVGTILWAEELGRTHFNYFLKQFGFGLPTNLELPGESSGLLLNPKDYSGTSLATIPLGQGISVTPIQLLYAYNAIANGGVYVPPRLIVATGQGENWNPYPTVAGSQRVISKDAAMSMNKILSRVVEEGTGEAAKNKNYTVAGKTGTARKPQPTGGYVDAAGNFHYITTFAGYFPAENPEVSIIVVIEEPQNSIYASATAVPIFSKFATYAGGYLQIVPSPFTRISQAK